MPAADSKAAAALFSRDNSCFQGLTVGTPSASLVFREDGPMMVHSVCRTGRLPSMGAVKLWRSIWFVLGRWPRKSTSTHSGRYREVKGKRQL